MPRNIVFLFHWYTSNSCMCTFEVCVCLLSDRHRPHVCVFCVVFMFMCFVCVLCLRLCVVFLFLFVFMEVEIEVGVECVAYCVEFECIVWRWNEPRGGRVCGMEISFFKYFISVSSSNLCNILMIYNQGNNYHTYVSESY